MFDASRRRFRLATYRNPERWATIKRAALVGGVTLALGLKSRKAYRGAAAAMRAGRPVAAHGRKLKKLVGLYGESPLFHDAPGNILRRHIGSSQAKLQALRTTGKALHKRGDRLSTSAKIVGGLGIGYAGMPYARKRGQHNNLRWQRKQWEQRR